MMNTICDMCPEGSPDSLVGRRGCGGDCTCKVYYGGTCCGQTRQVGIRVDFLISWSFFSGVEFCHH